MATVRVIQAMAAVETWADTAKELSLYRGTTEGILRRYMQASVELGRLPAPLGKGLGFLRAKSSAYKLTSFEDTMIFVCDVERCVKRLDSFEQTLVMRIAMQDYSMEETAELIKCNRRTLERRYPESIDKLTAMFLGNGMLKETD